MGSILKDSFKRFWRGCKANGLATTSDAGLMSAKDKVKLDSLSEENISSILNGDTDVLISADNISIELNDTFGEGYGMFNIPSATNTKAGLMSANDKTTLNELVEKMKCFNFVHEFEIYEDANCTSRPIINEEYNILYLKVNADISASREETYGGMSGLIIENEDVIDNINDKQFIFDIDFMGSWDTANVPKGTVIELTCGIEVSLDTDVFSFGSLVVV